MDSNQSMQPPPPSYEEATSSTTLQPVAATCGKQNFRGTVPVIVQPMYVSPTPTVITTTLPGTQSTIILSQGGQVLQSSPIAAYVPFGPDPVYIMCPACHVRKLTRIEYEPDMRTHLMAGILCLLGLFCCACLPYCIGSCMNAVHYCGNCNSYLGCYKQS